jgi:hypothetical protein
MLMGICVLFGWGNLVKAQTGTGEDDPLRFLIWLSEDTQAIPKSLLMTSPTKLAIGVSSLFAVSRFDESISKISVNLKKRELVRVFEELGDANAIRPLAFVIFSGSLFTDNHRFQDAAFTSFQSLIYANVLTNSLKLVFGRSRPSEGNDAFVFRPFQGSTSFPSGHATTAFAAITPWFLYYPKSVTVLAVIVATGTAFSRVPLLYHWPSDVVAGALVGFSTSKWLYRRYIRRVNGGTGIPDSKIALRVAPNTISMTLKW